MLVARDVAPQAVAALLRGQPLTAAKVRFAWGAAVGAAMSRATTVALAADGTLRVAAAGSHWRRETARSTAVVARRLAELLGPGVIKRIVVKES